MYIVLVSYFDWPVFKERCKKLQGKWVNGNKNYKYLPKTHNRYS